MKKYDSYKDSGVELIGKIPIHWEITKLKNLSSIFGRIGFRGYTVEDIVEKGNGAITLSPSNIIEQKLTLDKNTYLSWEKYNESPEIQIKNDDVILVKTASVGKVAYIEHLSEPATLNPQLVVFKNLGINNKYLYYLLISDVVQIQIKSDLVGGVVPTLSQSIIKNYYIPKNSIEEQTAIANYLDHKTSQIEHLISKKEQFIQLLEEERVAVINQAVTKGLDPNVSMKDSGIEWLGKIPEHWEVKRLRNIVDTIKTGSTPPSDEIKYFEPQEINWYGPGDFDKLKLGDAKRKISQLAIEQNRCRLFPSNSILLIGIGATVGKVGLSTEPCSSNQQINAIILKEFYNARFYLYFLSTIKEIIVMEASSATLPIFNQTQTKNISVSVPPIEEQNKIVDFIEIQMERVQTIIEKSKHEIELLKEYKTALISEVVTGKVDVREEALN